MRWQQLAIREGCEERTLRVSCCSTRASDAGVSHGNVRSCSSIGRGVGEDGGSGRSRARSGVAGSRSDGVAAGKGLEGAEDDLVDVGGLGASVAILVEVEDLACGRRGVSDEQGSENFEGSAHSTQSRQSRRCRYRWPPGAQPYPSHLYYEV